MITTHRLRDEEQRGQGLGWVPEKCQHAVPGDGAACLRHATHRATVQFCNVWFQSYVCEDHAALVGVQA